MSHNLNRSILLVLAMDLPAKASLAVVTLFLIREMPVEEYSQFTLLVSICSITFGITLNSINKIYIIEYESYKIHNIRGSLFANQFIIILFLFVIALLLSSYTIVIIGIFVFLVGKCVFQFTQSDLSRRLSFKWYSSLELMRSVLYAGAILGLFYYYNIELTAVTPLLIQGVLALLVGAPFFFILGLYVGIWRPIGGTRLIARFLAGKHLYLFGYWTLLALFSEVDVLSLSYLSDELQLATYGASFRYYALVLLALGAAHNVLLPGIAKAEDKQSLTEIFRKHRTLSFFAFFAILTGAIGSYWAIPIVDGGKYPQSFGVLQILLVSSIISFSCSPYVNLLLKFGEFRFLFFLISICLALNITLNFIFIPILGAYGAAATTLLAYAVLNGSIYARAARILRSPSDA